MSIFKRTQRKYVKKGYRVWNWREKVGCKILNAMTALGMPDSEMLG